MFESLSKKLSGVFDKLSGRGKISDSDVAAVLREIKIALLEADVALPVAKEILARVEEKAVGQKIIDGVKAAEQIIKIVNDELVEMLGGSSNFDISSARIIMMTGLNGGGKTTTTAKLARLLKEKYGRKVLVASTDIYRPQAREQLGILAERIGVDSLPLTENDVAKITKQAVAAAANYDTLILDTAGRMGVNDELMAELGATASLAKPDAVLIAVDALVGQDSVNVARAFNAAVPLSGIVMTRAEGDARGGAALSMKTVAGAPILFLGVGEKPEDLEEFHADRVASKILGMGDIVSLVEKAQEKISEEEAAAMAEKMFSGQFTLDDMLAQMRQMKKLGSISGIMKFIPGIGGMAEKLAAAGVNDDLMKKQEAIILSMTPRERREPTLIFAGRKKRIAGGSGTTISDVEKLLRQYEKSREMMNGLQKMGGLKGMMAAMKDMQEGE